VIFFYEGFCLIHSFYFHQNENDFFDFIPEKQNKKAFPSLKMQSIRAGVNSVVEGGAHHTGDPGFNL
jgi:hypothetical protein